MTKTEALQLVRKLRKAGRTGTYAFKTDDGWCLGQTKTDRYRPTKKGGDLFFRCCKAF